ncbi:MAG: hypothetical protein WBB94_02090 [Candidatus Saccharimonadaceae bacterium]
MTTKFDHYSFAKPTPNLAGVDGREPTSEELELDESRGGVDIWFDDSDNLATVVNYIKAEHPGLLESIVEKLPGSIECYGDVAASQYDDGTVTFQMSRLSSAEYDLVMGVCDALDSAERLPDVDDVTPVPEKMGQRLLNWLFAEQQLESEAAIEADDTIVVKSDELVDHLGIIIEKFTSAPRVAINPEVYNIDLITVAAEIAKPGGVKLLDFAGVMRLLLQNTQHNASIYSVNPVVLAQEVLADVDNVGNEGDLWVDGLGEALVLIAKYQKEIADLETEIHEENGRGARTNKRTLDRLMSASDLAQYHLIVSILNIHKVDKDFRDRRKVA